jgi:hypothetical protein
MKILFARYNSFKRLGGAELIVRMVLAETDTWRVSFSSRWYKMGYVILKQVNYRP